MVCLVMSGSMMGRTGPSIQGQTNGRILPSGESLPFPQPRSGLVVLVAMSGSLTLLFPRLSGTAPRFIGQWFKFRFLPGARVLEIG